MNRKEKECLLAQLNDEFGGLLEQPQKPPEPEEQPTAADSLEKPCKRTKDPAAKKSKGRMDKPLCIAIDEELMQKVRIIIYRESSPGYRRTLKDIVDEALEAYIRDYEGKNGPIK